MFDEQQQRLTGVVAAAGKEIGLPDYYWLNVLPLLNMPRSQWPTCCGGGCDPCNVTLCQVADRALALEQTARENATPR